MTIRKKTTLAILSKTPQATLRKTPQATRTAPAYGYAFEFEADDYTFYQYTANTCQTFDFLDSSEDPYEELVAESELTSDGQVLLVSFSGQKEPAMKFDRQQALPDSCISSLVANFDQAGYQPDALRDFDIFWQTFNDHYSFFELKNVDWTLQRDTLRSRVSVNTSDEELFDVLAEMITPLADGHNSIESQDGEQGFGVSRKPGLFGIIIAEYEQLPAEGRIELQEYDQQQLELAKDAIVSRLGEDAEIKRSDTENVSWSTLPNNIGYVLIDGMEGFSESGEPADDREAIDTIFSQVLSDLSTVDSMIIDLRFNEGGNDGNSLRIASHFAEARTLVYRKQARSGDTRLPLEDIFVEASTTAPFLKPVVLLTSTETASAAEVFILAMREVSDARLVGEASAGVFSDELPKSLPNGIEYSMSSEYYFDVNGEIYEDRGVPVDIEIPFFTLEDRQSGQDPILDAAMDLLRNP